ncbi:MAG TPA: plastocyanin/azurin family copper-binding protein [Nitrospiria bacterium]
MMNKIGPAVMAAALFWTSPSMAAEPTFPPPSNTQPLAGEVRIVIVPDAGWRCENAFDPDVVTIKAGTTVVWKNLDQETHTLISSEGPRPCYQKDLPPEKRIIDAGQVRQGVEYRVTFSKPGEYQFACHLPFHHMAGKIIVVP